MSLEFGIENVTEIDKLIKLDEALYNHLVHTFDWIESLWVDDKIHLGFDEIGYSVVSTDIGKFKDIVSNWLNLFLLAPNKINLILGYGGVDDPIIYTTVLKEDIIAQLTALLELIGKAILENKNIAIYA